MNCENTTFGCSLINILESKKPFTISDVMKFGVKDNNQDLHNICTTQGIQSCILAPVIKGDKLLGIIELVSSQTGELNPLNANNLDLILPYI
jgi:GAF domain-containing protein